MVSNRRLRNLLIISEVIKGYGGLNGKVSIQKFVYLLSYLEIHNLDYSFKKYHYGPYSEELQEDLYILVEEGLITTEKSGEKESFLPVDESIDQFIETHRDLIKHTRDNEIKENFVINLFQDDLKDTELRELAMTILWIIDNSQLVFKSDIFNAVDKWKKEYRDFTYKHKDLTWEILCKNDIIPKFIQNINKYIEELDNISYENQQSNHYKKCCTKILRLSFHDLTDNFKTQSIESKIIDGIDIKANIKSNLIKGESLKIGVKFINSEISTDSDLELIKRKFKVPNDTLGIIICRNSNLEYIKELNSIILTDSDLKNELLNNELIKKEENILLKKICRYHKFRNLKPSNIDYNSDNEKYLSVTKYLEVAKEELNLNKDYSKRNAGINIRLSVETLLKLLSKKNNLPTSNLKAQKLNDQLKNSGIITTTEWKFLNAYLGLGNDAAHTSEEFNFTCRFSIGRSIDLIQDIAKNLL